MHAQARASVLMRACRLTGRSSRAPSALYSIGCFTAASEMGAARCRQGKGARALPDTGGNGRVPAVREWGREWVAEGTQYREQGGASSSNRQGEGREKRERCKAAGRARPCDGAPRSAAIRRRRHATTGHGERRPGTHSWGARGLATDHPAERGLRVSGVAALQGWAQARRGSVVLLGDRDVLAHGGLRARGVSGVVVPAQPHPQRGHAWR